jgi:YtkA-like
MPPFAAHQDIEDCNMKSYTYARAFQAALVGIAMTGSATLARADIKDYEFRLVDQAIKAGPDRIITVRLINKTTGKPVPDAVIFATRLDMAPDGMQEMATKVTPMPGTEPGTYRFKATLSMAGGWQLSLGAKVQGETGTVENKLVITAQK